MKLYRILFCALLVVLPATARISVAQTSGVITETKVLAILDSLDRASRKGNLAGIVGPLATDVKIKWTISSPTGSREQVFNFNKEQYTLYTRRGLRKRQAYSLERKNTRVKIYDDGKSAMVTSDVYETLTVPQGTIRAASSELTIFQLRNGKIVATSIEARSRFY